jgi:transcription initiation factor TFIIH subunit 2
MEYDEQGSDDEVGVRGAGSSSNANGKTSSKSRGRAQAKWEVMAARSGDIKEGADGSLEGVLGGIEEAAKRKRYAVVLRM